MVTKQSLGNAKLLKVVIGENFVDCEVYSFLTLSCNMELDSVYYGKNVSNYDAFIKELFPIRAVFVKFYEELGENSVYKYIVTY